MPRVSSRNRITLPVAAMRTTGIQPGDEVAVRAVGDGTLLVSVPATGIRGHAGIATGIYEPDELDRLRAEWDR
jgi:bifunctional DNA-binding transcriptional regulator/antitoxin component of YhaV-PrlF toxin-antitoxin module